MVGTIETEKIGIGVGMMMTVGQMRKEWEERMKRWREMRNRGSWSRR